MKHNKAFQQLLGQYFTFNSHRLTCLIHIILGLFITQSVNLAKLSRTFSTKTKHQSVYKRLQRFCRRLYCQRNSCYTLRTSTLQSCYMLNFSGRWYSKEIIMQALRLYFRGASDLIIDFVYPYTKSNRLSSAV